MSGGIRTSVKGFLNAKRLTLSAEIDIVHETNETITCDFSALQAAADSVDKRKPQKKSIASTSYGLKIYYLGRLRHPNIVKLLGYCYEDDYRFLVYEFMPHGSLEIHLFGRASNLQPLLWILHMKIAFGALTFNHFRGSCV